MTKTEKIPRGMLGKKVTFFPLIAKTTPQREKKKKKVKNKLFKK